MESEETGEPLSQNWGLNKAANWKLTFCLWPRKCFLTDKELWLKRCYKGTRVITGPGEPVYEDYYIEKHEFMLWNLKGRM